MSQRRIVEQLDRSNQQIKREHQVVLVPIQNQPSWFTKYLPFHHLSHYFSLIQDLRKQNLKDYIAQFHPMLKNTLLWEKFIKKKQQFSLLKEIIQLELFGFIIMIITSILTGGCFIAAFYLQVPLVAAIMNSNNGQTWIITGIMIGVLIIKIFLFSYAENLSNNLGTNAKIHFQNTFMKSILQCGSIATRQKLETVYFYDGNIIRDFFLMIPYMTTAIVQVIGAIIFVFVRFKIFGLVPLGVILLMIFLHLIIFSIMNYIGKISSKLTQQRSNLKQNTYKNLFRIGFQGLTKSFYRKIQNLRIDQQKYYGAYTFLYAIAQVVGDIFPIITAITVYTIARDNPAFGFGDAILTGFFVGMTFDPIRILIFGSTFILSTIKSLRNFDNSLSKNRIRKNPIIQCVIQRGLMVENLGDFFKSPAPPIQQEIHPQANNSKQIIMAQIMLNTYPSPIQQIKFGKSTLFTGKINTQKIMEKYFQSIQLQLYQKYTLGVLDRDSFIIEGTIRQNILLTANFYQQTYKQSLKSVELERLIYSFQNQDHTLISSQSVKSIKWLALRIQLARIIYHNVDYFIIKRGITFQEQTIIKEVMRIRKKNGKTNIIISRALNFINEIDYVILFKNDGTIERGSPQNIFKKKQSQLKQLLYYQNNQFLLKQQKIIVDHAKDKSIQKLVKVQLQQLLDPLVAPAKALALIHNSTKLLSYTITFSIAITAIIRLYILQLIPRSFGSNNLYIRLLWSAITYLVLVILRGLVVGIYFNVSAKQLSLRLLRKFYHLSVGQIFRLYNRRQTTNNQIYIANVMNDNFFRDFEAGTLILFEIVSGIVYNFVRSYLSITFVLPVLLFVIFIVGIYLATLTKITLMKDSHMNTFNLFISDTIRYCKNIIGFKKSENFFNKYTKQNKMNVVYDINRIWAISGQRILIEFALVAAFIIILIVFIQASVRDQTFMAVSIALLVRISANIRYILKLKSHYQLQIIGCSQILRIIQSQPVQQPQPQQIGLDTQNQIITKFDKIQYTDLTIKIYDVELCRRVRFTINSGDRIAINGELSIGKQAMFAPLHHILKKKSILGDILIDGKSFWFCKFQGFNVMYSQPIFPIGQSVLQVMKTHCQTLTRGQLDNYLDLLWKIIGLSRLFTTETNIDQLTNPQRQLLYFVQQTMVKKCQLLLISDTFIYLDRKSLLKLLNYLIKQSGINTIVHLTNCPIIIQQYPKKYTFSNRTIKQYQFQIINKQKL